MLDKYFLHHEPFQAGTGSFQINLIFKNWLETDVGRPVRVIYSSSNMARVFFFNIQYFKNQNGLNTEECITA